MLKTCKAIIYIGSLAASLCLSALGDEYRSHWPEGTTRMWIGPEYWANRMFDWRLRSGRIECMTGDKRKTLRTRNPGRLPMRTVHLLSHSLAAGEGDFALTVRTVL